MKIELHKLTNRKLDWDDILPNNVQELWKSHFEMMNEIKNLKFKRAVVLEDAVDLNSGLWRCKLITCLHRHIRSVQAKEW